MNELHRIFEATGLINYGVSVFGRSYDHLRQGPPSAEVGYCNPALLCLVKYPGGNIQTKKHLGMSPLSQELHWVCHQVVPCSLVRWKAHFIGKVLVPFRVVC